MSPELALDLVEVTVLMHEPQQLAEEPREAVWQPVDRAEVEYAKPAVGEQPEIARVRIRVQEADPGGTGEKEADDQDAGPVSLGRRAAGDDPGQRGAVHPLADQHVVRCGDHMRNGHVRVVSVGHGERFLGGGFQPVVEFLGHPVAQLGQQGLGVEPGHEHAEQPGDAAQLVEVADECLACARVLDLDGDRAAVLPYAAVYLADGSGCRRLVVELGEAVQPVLAHIGGEDLVDGPRGQRRRGFLEPGQGGPVGTGDLRRECGLEDR